MSANTEQKPKPVEDDATLKAKLKEKIDKLEGRELKLAQSGMSSTLSTYKSGESAGKSKGAKESKDPNQKTVQKLAGQGATSFTKGKKASVKELKNAYRKAEDNPNDVKPLENLIRVASKRLLTVQSEAKPEASSTEVPPQTA